MKKIPALIVFFCFALAFAQPLKAAEPDAARAEVEKATAALHEALRTNNPGALFTHIAGDVVVMPPGEQSVRGKAAMLAWYSQFLSAYCTTKLTLIDNEVVVGDGWASEIGQFEWVLQSVAGGEPYIDRGNYIQIWKRQPDGRWLFSREIWHSSIPVPESSGT